MRWASTRKLTMLIWRFRFRWVACQLDLLGNCFSVRHLRQALASLPETLDDTYARILLNIDKQHNHYYREVLKLLQWLTFSTQPLRLEELAEIVAIDIDETPRFDPERRWPEPQDILMICSSLVTLTTDYNDATDEESSSLYSGEGHDIALDAALSLHSSSWSFDNGVEDWSFGNRVKDSMTFVRLAHFSVKEYLVSERIQNGVAARYSTREIESHGVLAGDCIAYLLQFDKLDPLPLETLEIFPLARYAAQNWTDHARHAQKGPVTTAACLSMELLMSCEGGLLNWVRVASPDPYWYSRRDLELGTEDLASPLYYASLVGLSEPVNKMIENDMDVNAKGGWCGSALQAASISGCTGIAQVLLDNGADIDAMGRYGTALCAFCYAGNYEIVGLLLRKGAHVDAHGEGEFDYGTPLQIASRAGHENIVKLLLDSDAGVNAMSDRIIESPLGLASCQGHEDIVKMLLDKGADINTQSEDSALQSASRQGYKNIVKILLDKGADIDYASGWVGTALQLASECGHENVAKILLENRADVNATSTQAPQNALQLATMFGNEDIVKTLLDKGADLNTQGGGVSALQLASTYGHEDMVKILLEKGADVNAQQGTSDSAFQLASLWGLEIVVKILLENGAAVNAMGPKTGRNALQLASEWGYTNVVKMFLEGADVNAWQGTSDSALRLASPSGHENVVKILLEKGADMNAKENGRSALEDA